MRECSFSSRINPRGLRWWNNGGGQGFHREPGKRASSLSLMNREENLPLGMWGEGCAEGGSRWQPSSYYAVMVIGER